MSKQLHKQFSNQEVKELLEKYSKRVLNLRQALIFLKVKRSRFFVLLKMYKENPVGFSIEFKRAVAPRRIDQKSENKIMGELKKEASLIADKNNPVQHFNYSYLKEVLETKHGVKVSLPTIISRAKKTGFIKQRNLEKSTTEKS